MSESVSEDWKSVRLSKNQRSHVLPDLLCGSKYITKISAFNEVGLGESSEEIRFATEGRPPIAPDKSSFITSNITSAELNLQSWKIARCPISHFEIRIKPKNHGEWITLSNNTSAQQESIAIHDLQPSMSYSLEILAHSEAGVTATNFAFSTMPLPGGTSAPKLLSDQILNRNNPFDGAMIVIPFICAAVLVVVGGVAVYMLLCKKRHLNIDTPPDLCKLMF